MPERFGVTCNGVGRPTHGEVHATRSTGRVARGHVATRNRVNLRIRDGVAKKAEPQTLHHDFEFANDRELDEKIAAFRDQYEQEHGQRLAMHARRSLGASKARITFRLVEAPRNRR